MPSLFAFWFDPFVLRLVRSSNNGCVCISICVLISLQAVPVNNRGLCAVGVQMEFWGALEECSGEIIRPPDCRGLTCIVQYSNRDEKLTGHRFHFLKVL